MPDRPSHLWKTLPPEQRLAAATAFWADDDEAAEVAQLEAQLALARRLNFRAKSIRALPAERRARHLAQMNDVSESVASRLLVSYHFAERRPLMSAFLDALGVAHDNGLITEESMTPPDADKVRAAVAKVRESFTEDDVQLYLRTLAALDEETWAGLHSDPGASPPDPLLARSFDSAPEKGT
jgi:hypothetical protein